MGMLKEFKEFAVRGNVIDMAVGIIIGGAFGKIVSSMVNDIIMPPIGLAMGNVDFSELKYVLQDATPAVAAAGDTPATEAVAEVAINYGMFINTTLDFIIVAFCIFMMIRTINKLKREEPAPAPAAPTTKECPQCCSVIPLKASRCPNCTSQV